MTGQRNGEPSLYAERGSTLIGLLGITAAAAAARVSKLLYAAKDASGLSSKEIATRLSITEGRVSQVLKGDGNVHIATAARFLRAMGYELTLSAKPTDPDRKPLNLDGRRSRRKQKPDDAKTYEVYVQMFLTHEGPMKVPMLVPADDTLRTTPHGNPAQIGRIRVSSEGKVRPLTPRRTTWQADAVAVNRIDG
jgi:transcriptional regulator with XRE-family HTH domain